MNKYKIELTINAEDQEEAMTEAGRILLVYAPSVSKAKQRLVEFSIDQEKTLDQLVEEIGVQEPPQDYRVFNRKQEDGTYRPLKEFFKS